MTFSAFSKLMGCQLEHLPSPWLCVCCCHKQRTIEPVFTGLTDAAMYFNMFRDNVLWPNIGTHTINMRVTYQDLYSRICETGILPGHLELGFPTSRCPLYNFLFTFKNSFLPVHVVVCPPSHLPCLTSQGQGQ